MSDNAPQDGEAPNTPPTPGAPVAVGDPERADALLAEAARHLVPACDALTAELADRLYALAGGVPGYLSGPGDLHTTLRAAVAASLDRLAAGPGAAPTTGPVHQIAAQRARQGVPLDAMLQALATAGALLWERLIDTAAELRPAEAHLLLHVTERMREARERNAAVVLDTYRQTLGPAACDPTARGRALLAAMLERPADGLVRGGAAALLGVPGQGRYAVAISGCRLGDLPEFAGRVLLTGLPDGEVLVAWLRDQPLAAFADAVRQALASDSATAAEGVAGDDQAAARAGVGPVVGGLAELPKAARLARAARAVARPGHPVVLWDDAPIAAMVAADAEVAGALGGRILAPVLALPSEERDQLLHTLVAWLDGDGATRSAAERLGCHRNTVLNRLRRLEQLTGRRLGVPGEMVELALAAQALVGTPTPPIVG